MTLLLNMDDDDSLLRDDDIDLDDDDVEEVEGEDEMFDREKESMVPSVIEYNNNKNTNDEEVDVELGESLNMLLVQFKKEIMKNYFSVKNQYDEFQHRSLEEMEKEIMRSNSEHIHTMNKLAEKMGIREHYLKKFKILTNNLAFQIHRTREFRKRNNVLRNVLHQWKLFAKKSKRIRHDEHIAISHYEKTTRRRILRTMYCWLYQNRAKSNKLSWEAKLESSVSQVQNDFENENERLEGELELTQDRLRRETRNKEVIQERLRKALMKGVCAMNNKFLGIIRDVRPGDSSVTMNQMSSLFQNMFQGQQQQQQYDITGQPSQIPSTTTTMKTAETTHSLFPESIRKKKTVVGGGKENLFGYTNPQLEDDDDEVEERRHLDSSVISWNNELSERLRSKYPTAKVVKPKVKVGVFREKKKMMTTTRRGEDQKQHPVSRGRVVRRRKAKKRAHHHHQPSVSVVRGGNVADCSRRTKRGKK